MLVVSAHHLKTFSNSKMNKKKKKNIFIQNAVQYYQYEFRPD